MDLERRISTVAFACRAAKDGSEKVVEGMAARYNRLSHPLPNPNGCGTFRERILPGAFKGCMGQDTVMLQDHDPSRILGRTKSGTLKLADTAQGLQFAACCRTTRLATTFTNPFGAATLTRARSRLAWVNAATSLTRWTKKTLTRTARNAREEKVRQANDCSVADQHRQAA